MSERGLLESRNRYEISIRAATEADLVSVSEILNGEIATSPYVYAETPVTLDERRAWLSFHAAVSPPVFVAMEADEEHARNRREHRLGERTEHRAVRARGL